MHKFLKALFAGLFSVSVTAQAAEPATTLDRSDTARQIHLLVWGGFETPDSIVEIISEEYLSPEELNEADRKWIATEAERMFAEKLQQQVTWPAETDWDRLDAAFQELDRNGIIAMHHAGNTQSDGLSDTMEEYDARKEGGANPTGYVFYHGQDVDGALEGQLLYLAFGAFDDTEATATNVAKQIVDTIESKGLKASWNGDLDQRIVIQPIEWRKRSPAG